jgi:phage terminase large subunit GpA-like protein
LNPILTDITQAAYKNIYRYIGTWKLDYFIPLISDWAAENRWLPAGTTEYPGKVDHSIAPHMVEIQDCLHPDSDISQVTVMKSTQSLFTTSIFSVFGHSIKYKLHNILYIVSSKNIAGILSSSAIDVMIDNSGLAEYVKPISSRMKKKVADNKFYKEFHGGRRLMMTSWNSIGDSKSLTWSLIFMDELDEAPYELAGQGDPESMFAGRAKTIRNLKIIKGGTPTTTNGRTNRNFLEGDQRFYYAQCLHCGEKQVLDLFGLGRDYGLRARSETVEGIEQIIPDTVEYVCKYCKKSLKEYQKGAMMAGGEWRPTARPVNPAYRSYQISNLMSPIMFYTWTRCMQEFCETDWGAKITKFKNFKIDVMGMPWEHSSEKKSWKDLKARADKYPLQIIPEGGLIVTGGTDVHKDFLEFQAVAWGPGMESWPVDHVKFYGPTENRNNKIWTDWQNYVTTKKYKLKNVEIPIAMNAIDSGYNPKNGQMNDNNIGVEHIVYEIVARTPRSIACRGNDALRDMILKQERIKRAIPLKIRYDVAVSELKDEIMVKVDLPPGSRGYIHFSDALPDEYFRGFLSEIYTETQPGKWEWKKIYERNEPLDTYILCRAAAERLNLASWGDHVWANYKTKLFM